MKRVFKYHCCVLTVVMMIGVWGISPAQAKEKSAVNQWLFASPDAAVKALQVAVRAKDELALNDIFGPDIKKLLTGDAVQDGNNMQRFSSILGHGYTFVKEGEDKIIIEVGKRNWPMPIPLAKINGQWYFDTAAGKDEIINRHIGKDELNAIGVCRAYVTAQLKYAAMNPEGGTVAKYAQKFRSTPGKKDGLYWPSEGNGPASPFGALVAQACAEGYCRNKSTGLHPYYGYYFRVLTGQGDAAPGGKMDYMSQDGLTRGFALVAYPVRWGQSGIMTFIVNQNARVYQRNFGKKTSRIAEAMTRYDPDSGWTLVQDEGVINDMPAE